MTASITAILVTYNSAKTIGEALAAIKQAHEHGLLDCVVIDNASRDGTLDLVKRDYPWVELVANKVNLGYGSGLNLGIERAATPYVLFMNPDAVLPANAVAKLLAFLQAHPNAGVIAPAIIEEGGSLQPAGVLPTPGRILARVAGLRTRQQRLIRPGAAAFQTDWLCGAILAARRDVVVGIGGFDPRFFLYFEETDLCRRLLDQGLELWAVGEAVARHISGASTKQLGEEFVSGCISEHYYRSRFYYLCKHFGWPAAVITEIAELGILVIRWVFDHCRRKKDGVLARRLQAPFLSLPEGKDQWRKYGERLPSELGQEKA